MKELLLFTLLTINNFFPAPVPTPVCIKNQRADSGIKSKKVSKPQAVVKSPAKSDNNTKSIHPYDGFFIKI